MTVRNEGMKCVVLQPSYIPWRGYFHQIQRADVFVFLSHHEGFGIPLVESRYFGVPVVARRSTAVSETRGQAGILLRRNHFPAIAEILHLLDEDKDFQAAVLAGQRKELGRFSRERVEAEFWRMVAPLIESREA